jgi:hypothetical protein
MKLVFAFLLVAATTASALEENQVFEWTILSEKQYSDPFNDVEVTVVATTTETTNVRQLAIPAFWSGSNVWRARFSFPRPGSFWLYAISSDPSDRSFGKWRTNVTVTPYAGANSFDRRDAIKVGRDKRRFEHGDGTAFLWLADTWWMGFTRRLHWDEFQELTRDRVAKGFNTVQIVAGLYPDMPAFDERGLGERGFPWTTNYSRINPEYFDAADKRIQHLCDNGLMPCIVGAWGYHLPWLGVDRMKKHWRYIIARWGAYPVVWCVAGEAAMPYYLSADKDRDRDFQIKGWTEIAGYIRKIDGFDRLITIHPTDYSRSQVGDPKVIDFEMLQTGHSDRASIPNTIETLRKSLRLEPTIPVINSEVCYEGIGGTCHDDVQRFFVWTSLLSGAAGHTYGANGIWQVNRREQPYGKSPHGGNWGITPWDDAMKLPGSRQTGFAKKLLERFEWWKFEPHPEWVSWDTNAALPQITWGDWIWFPEGDPAKDAPAEARYFRRTFEIPHGPLTRGTLRLAVDDKFIAYLNGERLGSHNTWRSFREFNITKRLQPGKNVLAVRAENTPVTHANPAGLLCGLEMVRAGAVTNVVSDMSWRVANVESPGWTNVVFDDSSWQSAKSVARYGDKPWERLPDHAHRAYTVPYAAGIAERDRIIYLPLSRRVVVRQMARGRHYRPLWFDPVMGVETEIGRVLPDARDEWTSPEPPSPDQDWVLILQSP